MRASVADRVIVQLGGVGASRSAGLPLAGSSAAADPLAAATLETLGLSGWRGAATGHQPTFWHGGILAKAMCAAELSRAWGCGWLHLVADHDAVDPLALPYPARRAGEPVRRAVAHFGAPSAAGTAACATEASAVRPCEHACPLPPASAAIAGRLERVYAALASADSSQGAAWRTVHANFALLSEVGALDGPAHTLCASELLDTPLGRNCAERIAADPEACARAFNDALALAPRAASRLRVDGDASEVPLWELGGGGVRMRISGLRLRALLRDGALDLCGGHSARAPQRPDGRSSAQDARGSARDRAVGRRVLLPRAFLATGIIRALGIHFVHGTGGDAYERAGDAWWRAALGRTLPPFSVATADLRFSAESLGLRADAVPPRLSWREAWVDPARLDGVHQDPERARAVAAIEALPRRSAARRRAFEAMRERVSAMRDARRGELDALASADAARSQMRAALAAATDRTYPAALHDTETLAALGSLVARVVSGSSAASGASGSRR